MADSPPDDGAARSDDTAKLELPSLNPFRRRRARRDPEPVEPGKPVDLPKPVTRPEAVAKPVRLPAPEPAPEPALTPDEDTEETRPFVPVPELTATNGAHAEEPAGEPEPASGPGQRKAARPRRGLPTLPAPLAALLGGLVVGAAGAGLTWVSLTGCDAIRGTESCGGAGVLVILVILVLMVLLGGLVLALLHLNDAKATSFLAVGVLFVVVLLTSGAAFVLAHWVTATFVEPQPEKGPAHDVR